jgi:pimeloyl-ACP methyl ester carboxylesterase
MRNREFYIKIDDRRTIRGEISIPETDEPKPLLIILHGFKGYKDWGFLPTIHDKFADRFIVIRYDHSMNGAKNYSDSKLYDIDDFRRSTISSQLEDLDLLISKIQDESLVLKTSWNGEIYLCGHSMGAAIAIIYSNRSEFIKKLILLAPIAKFDRYSSRQKDEWKKNGYIEFLNNRNNQLLTIDYNFILDLEKNQEEYDLLQAISRSNSEILIIHGEQDLTAKLAEAKALYKASNREKKRLEIIKQANHSFNVDKIGLTDNKFIDEVLNQIEAFLLES